MSDADRLIEATAKLLFKLLSVILSFIKGVTHCRFISDISDCVPIAVFSFHCEHHRIYSQQL